MKKEMNQDLELVDDVCQQIRSFRNRVELIKQTWREARQISEDVVADMFNGDKYEYQRLKFELIQAGASIMEFVREMDQVKTLSAGLED